MKETPELGAARERARQVYPRSAGFQGAYLAGAAAALAARPVDSCPYLRTKTASWRHAWRQAWLRGYQSATVPRRPPIRVS